MQLKHVVLPAPFGPISPTISNSSTSRLTSSKAWSPPKRIDSPAASRTGIDALRPRPAREIDVEPLALQPPPDRSGERPQPLRLEDEGEDGEDTRQRRNDVDGVVLEEADRLPPVREILAAEDVEHGEEDDAAPSPQSADDRDDEVRQGDLGEREVVGHH